MTPNILCERVYFLKVQKFCSSQGVGMKMMKLQKRQGCKTVSDFHICRLHSILAKYLLYSNEGMKINIGRFQAGFRE